MIKNKSILFYIILLILGTGIFIMNNKNNSIKTQIPEVPWHSLRKDMLLEICTILYTKKEPVRYNIRRENGVWNIIYPINIQALPEKAINLANTFLNLYPSRKLTNLSSEEFISYGLDKPVLKIAGILKNNKTNQFIIGKKTSIGNQYYIAANQDKETAYILDTTYLEPYIQGIAGIINNHLVTQTIDQINKIKFINFKKETLIFESSNNFWIQIYPHINRKIDWGVRRFLLDVKNLTFDPNSIIFDINDKLLSKFNINTNNSPQLQLFFNDGTKSKFFISSIKTNNAYIIYNLSQNLIATSDQSIIQEIFNTIITDFTINNHE